MIGKVHIGGAETAKAGRSTVLHGVSMSVFGRYCCDPSEKAGHGQTRLFPGIGRPEATGEEVAQRVISCWRTSENPVQARLAASILVTHKPGRARTPGYRFAGSESSLPMAPAEESSAMEGKESREFAGLAEATASATHNATHNTLRISQLDRPIALAPESPRLQGLPRPTLGKRRILRKVGGGAIPPISSDVSAPRASAPRPRLAISRRPTASAWRAGDFSAGGSSGHGDDEGRGEGKRRRGAARLFRPRKFSQLISLRTTCNLRPTDEQH